jgi:ABC-type cobalamin/Fe3+-siderophores transport system ATPase subunit
MTDDIRTWLNDQNYWLQAAAFKILSDGSPSDSEISELTELLKLPPESPEPFAYPNIGNAEQEAHSLELNLVGPVTGIDALNPRSPLSFGDNKLSIVYGSNGSGKSGYTRILKKASGKAGAVELKSNVYEESPETQECAFSYKLNDEIKEITWSVQDTSIPDLKSLDLFDTAAGEIYLEKETELSYTPPELTLFESLVSTCKRVEGKLNEEKRALVGQCPPILNDYKMTSIAEKYADLKHDSSDAELAALTTWTDELEAQKATLKARLETKDPVAEAKTKRSQKKQIDTLVGEIRDAAKLVAFDVFENYKARLTAATKARTASSESSKALSDESPLQGVGTDTWKALWLAAKDYSTAEAYPESPYPHTGESARCALCHQELEEAAKQRLNSFESYISGTLETQAQDAEQQVQDIIDALPEIPNAATIETAAQAANLSSENKAALISCWGITSKAVEVFLKKNAEATLVDNTTQSDELIQSLTNDSVELEKSATQLDEDAKEFDRVKAQTELLELEARKWISGRAEAIRIEVERLKEIKAYEEWVKETATRGISNKSGQLSETLITEAYILRFNQELEKLGAHQIQVELVKSRTSYGRNKHVVKLKNLVTEGISPADVFSEGEHRIVALAAFLADVCGRPSKTPFIFDDPITSLDQDYEEKVIDRLIELSEERQVLVFTHRLSFLGIMDFKSESANLIQIRRARDGTGHPNLFPYYKKKPITVLNTLKDSVLHSAKQAFDSGLIEVYHNSAKGICSEFRIQLEHIVESVLLSDVVKRHRKDVQTKNRIRNLSKINYTDCELIEGMMTKYSYFEHSQSDETPVDIPEPDELGSDIATILDWFNNDFKNRPLMCNGLEVVDI